MVRPSGSRAAATGSIRRRHPAPNIPSSSTRRSSTLLLLAALLFVNLAVLLVTKFQHARYLDQAAARMAAGAPPCDGSLSSSSAQREGEAARRRFNSSDATVLAMAQGYELDVHRKFVGSLRRSGFQGTILLATEPDLKEGVETYLQSQKVRILRVNYTECVHKILADHEVKTKKDRECNTCIAPYPNVKIRWGRFPFLRDALQHCHECTGPVLVTDVRDTLFQRDPFGDGAPEIEGLHFYAEHRTVVATHPFIREPIQNCKHIMLPEGSPMLCSGTTIGTRETMLGYLNMMYEEMVEWMKDENCWSKKAGGDQAIHNYLYYTQRFDHLRRPLHVYHPRQEIVNTVGAQGVAVTRLHAQTVQRSVPAAKHIPYIGINHPQSENWLPRPFDLTDDQGYFIDYNGERSRVVHQYDRFGKHVHDWVARKEGELWE